MHSTCSTDFNKYVLKILEIGILFDPRNFYVYEILNMYFRVYSIIYQNWNMFSTLYTILVEKKNHLVW